MLPGLHMLHILYGEKEPNLTFDTTCLLIISIEKTLKKTKSN